jgi:hypothetical protein
MQIQQAQQSFDKDAFDNLIRSQGVSVVHFRAIIDPTGMQSKGDTHASAKRRESSDGFIYKEVGTLKVFFSANTSNFDIHVEGMVKHDTAIMTLPTKYEDCDAPVLIAPYDRFFLKDVEVRTVACQLVEANTTGLDILAYPATCIEHLLDADGIEYKEDTHFKISEDGNIQWISQQRPGFDVRVGRGKVYSIRYRYTPFFICARLLHEIRVSQVTDMATFDRKLERMPYQILVVREHVLHDKNRDPHSNLMDNRFQYAPSPAGALGTVDEEDDDRI